MWMDEPFGMFSVMNTLFPILFFGIFALIIVMFVVTLARGAVRWRRNNASPVLTVEAGVVEYGMLAEGDRGRLTFQGTRYKGFERV